MFSCMLIVLGLVTVNAQVDSVLICYIKSNNSKFINPHAENGWNIHRYQWTIEEDGFVLEERFSLNDEPRSIRHNFTFFKVRLEFGKDNTWPWCGGSRPCPRVSPPLLASYTTSTVPA